MVASVAELFAIDPPQAIDGMVVIEGEVRDGEGAPLPYTTVVVEGTTVRTITDAEGRYTLTLECGEHRLVAEMLGYQTNYRSVQLAGGQSAEVNFTLESEAMAIDQVEICASGVGRAKRSAFNVVAVDTEALRNTTHDLSDALSRAPGIKLRESGGVGSDMSLMVDGFSGKHVKVFIDGVPQEGVGSAFSLNNIPAGYAERIEVYRGVVPVGFGADALGGVVNIVTNKSRRKWFADASYSFGSFNTHRSTISGGQTLDNGFMWEVYAFQNYSDNNYKVDVEVEDFETGRIKRGEQSFDESYYVNIEALAEGRSFLRTWYVGDNKFLMLMYDRPLTPELGMVANELAIFDATEGSLRFIEGLPAEESISGFGNDPYVEGGKAYIALTLTDNYPAIYVIDTATAMATKGLTVEATQLRAIGRLSPLNR